MAHSNANFVHAASNTGPNQAASDEASQIMASVSPQVHQVFSGGYWIDKPNKMSGFYRAGIIMSGDIKTLRAEIFIQWLAQKPGTATARVIHTAKIREISQKALQNAYLTLEDPGPNKVLITVTSLDLRANRELSFLIEAGLPGTYKMVSQQ